MFIEIQTLLIIAITITTLFIIIIGFQLILILKQVKKTLKKINLFLEEEKNNLNGKKLSSEKKDALIKKPIFFENILNKIKFIEPVKNKKRFFKKKSVDFS